MVTLGGIYSEEFWMHSKFQNATSNAEGDIACQTLHAKRLAAAWNVVCTPVLRTK